MSKTTEINGLLDSLSELRATIAETEMVNIDGADETWPRTENGQTYYGPFDLIGTQGLKSLDEIDVHRAAADALCEKMKWTGRLIGAQLKEGWVFVFDDEAPAAPAKNTDWLALAASQLRDHAKGGA